MAREEGPAPWTGRVRTGQVDLDLAFVLQHAGLSIFLGISQIAAVDGTRRHGRESVQGRPQPPGHLCRRLGRRALRAGEHLTLEHQGTLGEELAYRAILGGPAQTELLRVREGTAQGDRFPDPEPTPVGISHGLHLKVDAHIL
jgi:hypothetical protein